MKLGKSSTLALKTSYPKYHKMILSFTVTCKLGLRMDTLSKMQPALAMQRLTVKCRSALQWPAYTIAQLSF